MTLREFARKFPTFEIPWLFFGDWLGFATPFGIVVKHKTDPFMIEHEYVHIEQWYRYWIIGFIILYIYELVTKGYYNNRFEKEARELSIKRVNKNYTYHE